jgi:hypothetical protein
MRSLRTATRPSARSASFGPTDSGLAAFATGRAVDVSDALLADVVRRGWLRPPIAPSEVLPARKPVAPLADLLHELDEDRGDR